VLCERWRYGPPTSAFRGRASNHPVLRWLKTVVVSDREKAHVMCQVGTRKTYQKIPGGVSLLGVAVEASLKKKVASKLGILNPFSGRAWRRTRVLARWCPACRRREPGLRLLHGT